MFVPVLLLTGAAKFLFTPLAMAVVLAMLTSYLLTRTLVPTMVHSCLPRRDSSRRLSFGRDTRVETSLDPADTSVCATETAELCA